MSQWEKRCKWLIEHAEGFYTPDGWGCLEPDEETFAEIDEWIKNKEMDDLNKAMAPEAFMAEQFKRLVDLGYNPFFAFI